MKYALNAQQPSLGVSSTLTAAAFKYQIGRRVSYVCPATPPPSDVVVWGTKVYTFDSAVCVAAIHDGVLAAGQAGLVTFVMGPGAASFAGFKQNGVTSDGYGAYDSSFSFDRGGAPGRIDGMTTTRLPAGFAAAVAVDCPPIGTFPQPLWGTDIYADDSSICAAAVHFGLFAADAGRQLMVTASGPQASFEGSVRNGITSQKYPSWPTSFKVSPTTSIPAVITAIPAVTTGTIITAAPAVPEPPPSAAARAGTGTTVGEAPVGRPVVTSLENGPAPTGLIVTGTPTTATVQWQPVAGATGYLVNRAPLGTTNWVAVTPAQITATTSPVDSLPGVGQAYPYQVVAFQADAQRGAATVDFTAPKPVDPEGLTGELVRPAEVRLKWQPVPGVDTYLVSGPGVPAGQLVRTTSFTLATAPSGFNIYNVASSYSPGGVVTAATAWPGVRVVVPPTPTIARLTLPNGAGSLADYNRHACAAGKWVAAQLAFPNNWCDLPGPTSVAQIQLYPLLNLFDVRVNQDRENEWPPADEWSTFFSGEWHFWAVAPFTDEYRQAVFTDTVDLDRARRVGCVARGTAPNEATLCWALSEHARSDRDKTLSIIVQEPEGDYFLVMEERADPADRDIGRRSKMFGLPAMTLDSQGPRFAPHACLSCHGGRFDPATGRVQGATLLPLDPRSLDSPSGPSGPGSLQFINSAIYRAPKTAPGVRTLLDSLYQGKLAISTDVDLTAVPRGWSSQAQLYLTVFRPHCASCHNTMSGSLAFQSWDDLVLEKVRVQRSICTGTMPHSEAPFWRFWTGGGPVVSWPGLLLAALGYEGC